MAGGNRYLTLNGRRDIGGIDLPSHGNYLGSLTVARDYEIRALYPYNGRPCLYPEKRPLAAEKTPDYYARVSAYDPEYGAPQVAFSLIYVTLNLRARVLPEAYDAVVLHQNLGPRIHPCQDSVACVKRLHRLYLCLFGFILAQYRNVPGPRHHRADRLGLVFSPDRAGKAQKKSREKNAFSFFGINLVNPP